jgi:hypothetical protein
MSEDNLGLPQIVAKLRRDMPRNAYVLAVCNEVERLTYVLRTASMSPISVTSTRCPVCEARRKADTARQSRWRKNRAATRGEPAPHPIDFRPISIERTPSST